MISLNVLLDIIATEAVEEDAEYKRNVNYKESSNLPSIKVTLELIEREDRSLYWIED